jgi:hypothetical protein
MIRFFIWQCGTIAFVAVIWRYGYWREIIPLVVLGSAFLWIVCGGILISRGGRKGARLAQGSPVDAGGKSHESIRDSLEQYRRAGQSDSLYEQNRASAATRPRVSESEK